ncbi:MAG: stage II sporulation protein D [Bacillota bacterium]|nr:stage II sporulation protein D [Bacillota bacterium]
MKNVRFNFQFRSIKFLIFIVIFGTLIFSITAVMPSCNNTANNNISNTNKFNMADDSIIHNSNAESEPSVSVFRVKENKKEDIELEEYVRGVVATEMPIEYNVEALKAQAVASRTYAVAHMECFGGVKSSKAKGANVTDNTDCQVYNDKEDILKMWTAKESNENWSKLNKAVSETQGEILTYNNDLVLEPLFFSISTGKTDSCKDIFNSEVPYLQSIISEGEASEPNYKKIKKVSVKGFVDTINDAYPKAKLTYKSASNVSINGDKTSGGTVKQVKIGNCYISGVEFRSLFSLRSADFSINFPDKNNVNITTVGYGHNVGMSQWGSNVMAKSNKNYIEILTHYYKGVKIKKLSDLKKY